MVVISEVKPKTRLAILMQYFATAYWLGFTLAIGWYKFYMKKPLKSLPSTKWFTPGISLFLVIFLCHNRAIRCTLTLAIPILCSSKGRSLLIAFAFLMVAAGPTANIVRNVDVLAESMTCSQEQLKEALGDMLDVLKQPLVAIKDALGKAMNEIRKVMARIELMLFRIQELVMLLLASIKNAYDWLQDIVSICNKEFGTPFERCMTVADKAMADCREKMGIFDSLCHVTKVFQMLCYGAKVIDAICVMVDFSTSTFIKEVTQKLQKFVNDVKTLFDVRITFDHDYYFKTVASQNISDVASNIVNDIHKRTTAFLVLFTWLDLVGSLLFLTVLFKAIYFRVKFLRNPSYKNTYITRDFDEVHEKRRVMAMELVLPLTFAESLRFVRLTSCRLTSREVLRLARSCLFLTISCIQIFCVCFADYSLYWMLALIASYGEQQEEVHVPPFITLNVQGAGLVADVVRGVVKAFEPMTQKTSVNMTACLPRPFEPNYTNYSEIGAVCGAAWLCMMCQPYALRTRHVIMRFYYPDLTRRRAAWLYHQILINRISFFKLARRKARAKFLSRPKDEEHVSCLDWWRVKCGSCFPCRWILGKRRGDHCLICTKSLKSDDKMECSTPGCKGIYCEQCFFDSNRVCCICKSPVEYNDYSDVSEEKDSSDELTDVYIEDKRDTCS